MTNQNTLGLNSSGVSGRIVAAIPLLLLAAVCVVPLAWLITAPSRTEVAIANGPSIAFGSFGAIGTAWQHLMSYEHGILLRWLFNTVLYSAAIVALAVVVSVSAGYALAVTRMVGRRVILLLSLVAMVVPGAALVLPLFLIINSVHLTGTAWAVILPSSVFPFGAYLSFIHFSSSIPRSVYEAARIDGASEWRIFTQIALPLSRSLIGLVAFFAFVGAWTNYFLPFVMLTDENTFTLQLGLQSLLSSSSLTNPGIMSNLPIHRPEGALAAIVTVLPVAIVFVVCQRYLARGILGGAVKD